MEVYQLVVDIDVLFGGGYDVCFDVVGYWVVVCVMVEVVEIEIVVGGVVYVGQYVEGEFGGDFCCVVVCCFQQGDVFFEVDIDQDVIVFIYFVVYFVQQCGCFGGIEVVDGGVGEIDYCVLCVVW